MKGFRPFAKTGFFRLWQAFSGPVRGLGLGWARLRSNQPRLTRRSPPAHTSSVIRLTHRDFDAVIHSREWENKPDTLVVVKFGAIWCPPCRLMDKVFARIWESNRLPWVTFFEVDIDADPELAGRWRFQSIPFTLFFCQGEPLKLSDPKYESCEDGLLGGLTETEFVRLCESLREARKSLA